MRTPMPSPKGTNTEGLYLTGEPAKMALDAAPKRRLATDENIADTVAELVMPLRGRISDPLLFQVQAELADSLQGTFEDELDKALEAVKSGDDPRGMDGLPQHLRTLVADGVSRFRVRERARVEALMPDLARIRVLP